MRTSDKANPMFRLRMAGLVIVIGGMYILQSVALAQLPRQLLDDPASQQRINRLAPSIIAESAPLDDAVLITAPSSLGLSFPENVRLVKLALYNENKEWIDINFRYDPRPDSSFAQPIPALQQTSYYTADWAVLAANDLLVRGSFSFSFGAGAEPPSIVKQRAQILLQLQDAPLELEQLERLRRLGLDPAEIIINDDEPPQFEPPFTPILN